MTDNAAATVAFWSYVVATVAYAGFALRLALGWRRSGRAALLVGAVTATVLWAAGSAAVSAWPASEAWPATIVFDALRYAFWLAFLASLLSEGAERHATIGPLVPHWTWIPVAACLLATVLLREGAPFAPPLDVDTRTVTFGARLALAVIGLILIEQLVRRIPPRERWAIKPLAIGLAGVFGFDLLLYADAMLFGALDVNIWTARAIANALVIPFLVVATARNSGWTIEIHVSRAAVFQSTALLLSGAFLLAVAGAGYFVRYVGGDWGRALQIELLFAAVLAAALMVSSGTFRSKLRVFVSKHFFSFRYDYREEWLRFTRTLSGETSLRGLQESTIRALADLVESPGGWLWLRDERNVFAPAARLNAPATDASVAANAPLAQFLAKTGWVIDLGEYAAAPADYPGLTLPGWTGSIAAAWLIVPLLGASELVGFVMLAASRATIKVDWEVRDLLKTASRQAASYLGHVRATEALLEARKFDAFNRMSAFVVHDLKNLVAQLSLMLRNAERHRGNPEFQRDMQETVQNAVERMNKLMLQLRADATPVEKPRVADLEGIVRRIAVAKSAGRATIALDLAPGVSTLAHEERLEHVIGHLVQNAQDATKERGEVAVKLYRDGEMAVVEISDTGVGMSADFVRDRLFKPFETTKSTGMGIGVYESSQYVTQLGGRIAVDSTPDVGTKVSLLLPLSDGASPAGTLKEVA